jgi:hypothetical protein
VEHLVQFHEQGRQLPLLGPSHHGIHHVTEYFGGDVQLYDADRLEAASPPVNPGQ